MTREDEYRELVKRLIRIQIRHRRSASMDAAASEIRELLEAYASERHVNLLRVVWERAQPTKPRNVAAVAYNSVVAECDAMHKTRMQGYEKIAAQAVSEMQSAGFAAWVIERINTHDRELIADRRRHDADHG